MNILYTLTLRHMRLNRRRTWVTLIGVILSVTMITAVSTLVSSYLGLMKKDAIEKNGNWHVAFKHLSLAKVDEILGDQRIASSSLSKDLGYALLKGSKNESKPYLFVRAFDPQGFQTFQFQVIDGRLPEKEDEIAIASHIAEDGGVDYKIGDVLILKMGERQVVDEKGKVTAVNQNFPFNGKSREQLVVSTTKKYTVTGIIQKPGFEYSFSPGYTVITYLDRRSLAATETVDLYLNFKNISPALYQQAGEIASKEGILNNIDFNENLLQLLGVTTNDRFLSTLYGLEAIFIAIIMIGSIALIYNAFAISAAERSRHLGMLASVGATKKQKRLSILFEGFVVGIIGIPAGLLFGTLGLGLTFWLVAPLTRDLFPQELSLTVSPAAMLTAALISAVTIGISAYIPARRTAKISPIEAIRQMKEIHLTRRTVRTSKITRKLFGMEAELGLKNLKRNNRRYKATLFSLVLSIVLFLSISSFTHLARQSAEMAVRTTPFDLQINVTSSAATQEKKAFYQAIAKMKEADQSVIQQYLSAAMTADLANLSEPVKSALQRNMPKDQALAVETVPLTVSLIALDDTTLNRYAAANHLDPAALRDGRNPKGILMNTVEMKVENRWIQTQYFKIRAGEKLHLRSIAQETQKRAGPEEATIGIAALADKDPLGATRFEPGRQIYIYVSEQVFAALNTFIGEKGIEPQTELLIKSAHPDELVKRIEDYKKEQTIKDVNLYNAAEMDRRNRNLALFMDILSIGFVLLITAISVANMLNTLTTSISLRRRELAMLRSIGMTPAGFTKMIRYESLFYGIKAILFGLPISFAFMVVIYRVLGNSFGMPFSIPWDSLLIAIIAVFAIFGLTMLYATSKVKKENIIDALTEENV